MGQKSDPYRVSFEHHSTFKMVTNHVRDNPSSPFIAFVIQHRMFVYCCCFSAAAFPAPSSADAAILAASASSDVVFAAATSSAAATVGALSSTASSSLASAFCTVLSSSFSAAAASSVSSSSSSSSSSFSSSSSSSSPSSSPSPSSSSSSSCSSSSCSSAYLYLCGLLLVFNICAGVGHEADRAGPAADVRGGCQARQGRVVDENQHQTVFRSDQSSPRACDEHSPRRYPVIRAPISARVRVLSDPRDRRRRRRGRAVRVDRRSTPG